jgi:hypothetical protein
MRENISSGQTEKESKKKTDKSLFDSEENNMPVIGAAEQFDKIIKAQLLLNVERISQDRQDGDIKEKKQKPQRDEKH